MPRPVSDLSRQFPESVRVARLRMAWGRFYPLGLYMGLMIEVVEAW